MEDPDSGYTIDQHLSADRPGGARARERRAPMDLHQAELARDAAATGRGAHAPTECCLPAEGAARRAATGARARRTRGRRPAFPILLAETAPGRMSCAANGQMFRI